ncbi:putative membrane protein YphA (DoxX/SURF4 family) [Knoellia remsis]|uniref:Putative membrane protein YphA (DoxX/SURF4 family) n=1 Tax=Knoellia remsis TaxID=407159 RepID=A0A2T0UYD8_9MICO|nr:DoxX family membrane protein [Knoellia remsis]PRY62950.1 putative membrane protein YphA (DoxX/SURF4 family) [Knoellia remsis]
MSLVRRIARPMLAAMFVAGGLDQLKHPGAKAKAAKPVVDQAAKVGLPDDPELLVRANGVAMLGGGALLGTGTLPRLGSAVLAGSLVPTTLAAHAFWNETDPQARAQQKIQFLKNLGLLGGVLLAAVDTDGKPSLAWRARRASHDAQRSVSTTKREARMAARAAKREAKLKAAQAKNALT